MRIFICELKKIWNWRILLIIIILGIMVWLALLPGSLRSFNIRVNGGGFSMHGGYGSYITHQLELFYRYGETLEPEELADYNFPGRYAAISAEWDAAIVNEPVFAKYGITNFADFMQWYSEDSYWTNMGDALFAMQLESTMNIREDSYDEDKRIMFHALSTGGADNITPADIYKNPIVNWGILETLERRFVNYHKNLESYLLEDTMVARAAERIIEAGNNSLLQEDYISELTMYASVTGIIAVVAVMVLITPILIVDRSRKIHLLQYSSVLGRRIFRTQFIAVLVSATILSVLIMLLSLIPVAVSAQDYLDTSIMMFGVRNIWMYPITFGQFFFVLGGMAVILCVGVSCVTFLLARFSLNIVNMMVKAVPAGIAFSTICALAISYAFSNSNYVFHSVFRGQFNMPEIIVCAAICIVCILGGVVVVMREKRVDVA